MALVKSLGVAAAGRLRGRPTLGRVALRLVPDVRHYISVPGIGPFVVRLRRHRSYWLRHPLHNDRFAIAAFRRFVSQGDVVWDLGANIGLYSRFARRFGASHVVSVEPMPDNQTLLDLNLRLDDDAKAYELLAVAVSDGDGEELLQVDDMMSQTATLDSVAHGRASQGRAALGLGPKTVRVTTRTLDRLIFDEDRPRPDVMKIDVEGAELAVLAGGRRTLDEIGPKLLVETHSIDLGRQVTRTLLGHGYHVGGGVAGEYRRLDEDCLHQTDQPYDLHFLVADKQGVPDAIEPADLGEWASEG